MDVLGQALTLSADPAGGTALCPSGSCYLTPSARTGDAAGLGRSRQGRRPPEHGGGRERPEPVRTRPR